MGVEANEEILKVMQSMGCLLFNEDFEHSYPHCWRHKTPTAFRVTPQWFISMEQAGLRANALEAIKDVRWVPGWGEERIKGMVQNRPDWCISRQRTWGVPITLFVDRQTNELHPDAMNLMHKDGRTWWKSRALIAGMAMTFSSSLDVDESSTSGSPIFWMSGSIRAFPIAVCWMSATN